MTRILRGTLLPRILRHASGCIIAALLVLAGTQAAATVDEEAQALCAQALLDLGALDVRDVEVHHNGGIRFAYGTVEFPDAPGVHFRCRVYDHKVDSLRYLVRDPELVDGRVWSRERPHGSAHLGLRLDHAAKLPPPAKHVSPHFERVPQ